MSDEKIQPDNCVCGSAPLSTRAFNGSSWQCRVGCMPCGITTGRGDDMPYAVKTWNRIQEALAPKPEVGLGTLSILVTGLVTGDYKVTAGSTNIVLREVSVGPTQWLARGVSSEALKTCRVALAQCKDKYSFMSYMCNAHSIKFQANVQ